MAIQPAMLQLVVGIAGNYSPMSALSGSIDHEFIDKHIISIAKEEHRAWMMCVIGASCQ